MRLRIIAVLLFLAHVPFGEITKASAQVIEQDTSIILQTIEIQSLKIRTSQAGSLNKEWTADELEKLAVPNLADLLGSETGTYIKTYGLGSIATSSIRGGSAGHTLVLWNGLPIHSPMLGLLDLSLTPTQAADNISIAKGGHAAMWGSGAIGGVINMSNSADFSTQLEIRSNTSLGSFGHFGQQLTLHLGDEKLQSVTKYSHLQADNDFHYSIADGLPEREQSNASLSQQYLGQDLYWKVNKRNHLDLHFWRQQSDRQIPPTNVQNRSEAHQDDLSTRLLLEYKHISDKVLWELKSGFFEEQLNYFDDLTLIDSPSRFRSYLAELTAQWYRGKHKFLFGNLHTHTQAWAEGYRDNNPSEYKTALFASWDFQGDRWRSLLSLRQEMVDGNFVPTVPAFGIDWHFTPSFTLKGKLSRNYRLPTMNDRYWMPGGNPELLPESGWSQELTLVQERKRKNTFYDFSLTAFNRNINDWILWTVQEGQSYWSAHNISKVWSRGLESRLSATYQGNKSKYKWVLGHNYVRSTNQVALENPKINVGEQLLYTPLHQIYSTFSAEWKNLNISYRHNFTGETRGINEPLDAFQIGNLRLQYSTIINQYKGSLFFKINNIWDADYFVVERRPMPGLHFHSGINFTFNKNQKNQ